MAGAQEFHLDDPIVAHIHELDVAAIGLQLRPHDLQHLFDLFPHGRCSSQKFRLSD